MKVKGTGSVCAKRICQGLILATIIAAEKQAFVCLFDSCF